MSNQKEQTSLAKNIDATNDKIRYDMQVKTVLANKSILARIVKYTVEEFSHLDFDTIIQCIEGNPEVSCVPMEPGLSNVANITGLNTEDAVPNEGTIYYDIKFYIILPTRERTKIIINMEAQNAINPGYDLVTRALYYCARLLSAQLNREFSNNSLDKIKYDGIKKVYSIWICMASYSTHSSIVRYGIEPRALLGTLGKSRYDIMTAVMIYLGSDQQKNELIGMLTTLLSTNLDRELKKKKLHDEYFLPMTNDFIREVDKMCDLSTSVEKQGIEQGFKQGFEQGVEQGEQKLLALHQWLTENGRMQEAADVLKNDNTVLRTRLYAELDKAKK